MPNIYNNSVVVLDGGAKIPVDNGIIYEGKYRVRYFDIDGTILKIEYIAEGGNLTPPSNPNYDPEYLIFDEWNYDIENYIVEQPTDVGATYKTVDDATYMFCRFTKNTGLNPNLAISGYTSINWGDETIDTNKSHTYEKEGDYVIKIKGNVVFSANILGDVSRNAALKKLYISKELTSNKTYNISCSKCVNLEVIAFPRLNNGNYIDGSAFLNTFNLKCFIAPRGVKRLSSETFYRSGIEHLIASQGFERIGKSALNYANSLKDIVMPPTVIELGGTYCFDNNPSLKEIWIPKSMQSIYEYNFGGPTYTYTAENIFIASTTPLTLGMQCFVNLTEYNKGTIFWVNDNIIEELKVAKNWSTYASRMKPLSWYPSLTDPNA